MRSLPLLSLLGLGLAFAAAAAEPPLPAAPADSDYHYNATPAPEKVTLGRQLFFDKLLSGNRNISCASCHHPDLATGDGLALSIGEGGRGLGDQRTPGRFPDEVHRRVGRNAQPLFNVGAREYTRMFHDGRVEVHPDDSAVFLTPAGEELPDGLDNVLAAQAMFPVASDIEMAGEDGENAIATAAADEDFTRVWTLLAQRLRAIPEYVELFRAAYPQTITQAGDIRYVHAANALAAFQTLAWRADDSPFDAYLRGNHEAMNAAQKRGMKLFYGKAGCVRCHSGPFQTDHEFHAIGMPQIGPGKASGYDGHEDFGREMLTGSQRDRYRFRTPALRNVELTGPWGHAGAFDTLEATVRHHLSPSASLEQGAFERPLSPRRADLAAIDYLVQRDSERRGAIARASELQPVALSDGEIQDLLAFLTALTDPSSRSLARQIPEAVPSGLGIERYLPASAGAAAGELADRPREDRN